MRNLGTWCFGEGALRMVAVHVPPVATQVLAKRIGQPHAESAVARLLATRHLFTLLMFRLRQRISMV